MTLYAGWVINGFLFTCAKNSICLFFNLIMLTPQLKILKNNGRKKNWKKNKCSFYFFCIWKVAFYCLLLCTFRVPCGQWRNKEAVFFYCFSLYCLVCSWCSNIHDHCCTWSSLLFKIETIKKQCLLIIMILFCLFIEWLSACSVFSFYIYFTKN